MNRVAIIGLSVAAVTACTDRAIAPPVSPTALQVALDSPQSDDGAVVITLHGPDVSDLQSASATYLTYIRASRAGETRVIVAGDLIAGPLLTFTVGAGHRLGEYSATIEQVATRADALREDLSGYGVTILSKP
jgi:tRNA threonylcarbamoyladenosine modification (KEOPS) complex  Pcc1 subunit